MAYFRWVEGEMEGYLIACDTNDARRLLGEADNPALVIEPLSGALDPIDFAEAQAVLGDQHPALLGLRSLGLSLAETIVQRSSHFGGLPRLSQQIDWPGGANPLPLLLELDLAEVTDGGWGGFFGFPATGYLALFFDLRSSRRDFAVCYSPAGSPVRSAPVGSVALEPRSVVSGLELTSPHPEDPAVIELLGDDVELLESYAALYAESAEGCHRLLGHAYWINEECAVPEGCIQLFQIRGEPGSFGVNAEECYLHVFMPEADLAALDFSRCELVLQLG
ncbi:MAG: DUF1963 domain-containing protein [Polyangiaceae bacterium]|nr:DUF1963 domain-containing protein [Myxococcales bacterium]MCB9587094.1 DUF1963 domain-containing protein [Polyangiaceae bacterium]MCB9609531.1 DUF1963 domain-containing protein [Polyangiaceae bacterium]